MLVFFAVATFHALLRSVGHRELLLLERGYEEPHGLDVQLTEGRSWLLTSKKRLGSLDQLHVLFSGAELHLVLLRPGRGRQLRRRRRQQLPRQR